MNLISNYKRFKVRLFLKKFFQKKKNLVVSIFAFEFLVLLFIFSNYSRFARSFTYIKTIDKRDLISYLRDLTTSFDLDKKIQKVNIDIDFKNSIILDCQRERRENCSSDNWARGSLTHNKIVYPIKLRAKGDRDLHRIDFKTMSFKVDIRGEKRYRGMEEFAIQSPIIRNYTYELLAAKLINDIGIIAPRNHYVRLYLNGEYLGIRHIEESFSRELIEASGRRYGPVFSLDENVSRVFGKTRYDLSDFKNWSDNKLASDALSVLELSQRQPKIIKSFFDDNWANYFALMDVLITYHAVIPKSAKIYLNPTTGLFEPAFFDGHMGNTYFENFLLVDLIKIKEEEINCAYLCNNEMWYRTFFKDGKDIDIKFYSNYFNALKKYSSKDFELNKIDSFRNELKPLRGALYREFSRNDDLFWRGNLPYIARHSILKKRLSDIRNKIKKAESNKPYFSSNKKKNILSISNQSSDLPQIIKFFCGDKISEPKVLRKHKPIILNLNNFSNCSLAELNYSLDNMKNSYKIVDYPIGNLDYELKIGNPIEYLNKTKEKSNMIINKQNINISQDLDLENKNIFINSNVKICIEENAVLTIKNSSIYDNGNQKISFLGCGNNPGSVVFKNSNIDLKNIEVRGLSFPIKNLHTLYGGLNIVQSQFKVDNLLINNSLSEDGVNFINSKIDVKKIQAKNIQSDAIDSDSSSLKISEIICEEVKNDCLDLSYSRANVNSLYGRDIQDKVVSAGEASILNLIDARLEKSEIGIVAKDSSNVYVNNFNVNDVVLPIAAYIKKPELGSPSIKMNSFDMQRISDCLISNDSEVFISGKKIKGSFESKKISNMLYGNLYGVKTKR